MKILIVSQYFFPETFRVNTLCTELVKRGHDVTVMTGYPQYPQGRIYDGYGFNVPYEKTWNGAKIIRVKAKPRGKTPVGLLINCWSYAHYGKKWARKCEEKYDAVYVFGVSPVTVGLPAVEYNKKFGTPVFYNVQDLWPENVEFVLGIHNRIVIGIINKIVDKIYSVSEKILCSSNAFVDNIEGRGVERDKLVYWPQFCTEPEIENTVKPDVFDDNAVNIVFAGNIGNAQGLDLLIETADRLKDKPLKWVLVGDGRARERLQKSVNDRGIQDKVCFVGKVSEQEANRYIHYADYAYLSFVDNRLFDMTIPAKLQSYLACGTPILAAAGGESAKLIKQADCGVTSKQNTDSLAAVIEEKVLNRENIEQYRKNAYDCYCKNFNKDLLVDELVNIFSKSL